ncbi:hypothetical protein [Rhizobium sp. BR 249]|uniref:hypothetical protein n=1 Tax=Rhizobium sp. BR 249 TaxID=3040011 RepID=UPI0039BEF273
MSGFFNGIKGWAYDGHRLLIEDIRSRDIDEHSFGQIHQYCASLLATVGIVARASEAQLEEELYDLYQYWQGRASFASDYSLEWDRVGVAPLPTEIFMAGSLADVQAVMHDDVVFASLFARQHQLGNIFSRNPQHELEKFIEPLENRFLELIEQSSHLQYHTWGNRIRWSILLPGPFSLIYPTRAFVDEVNLSDRALKLLGQLSGVSLQYLYPEYGKAA